MTTEELTCWYDIVMSTEGTIMNEQASYNENCCYAPYRIRRRCPHRSNGA